MFDYEVLKNAMADLEEDQVFEILNAVMANGDDAQKAVLACQEGMHIVGERFDSDEYFVGDLIFAGEILTGGINIIKPALAGKADDKVGRMILCTVKDDLHDIGKNIVKAMMEAGGFEVLDLGIDVAPEAIVEAAKKENIKIIALSGVLTLALNSMKATAEAFKTAGMRDSVKIIVGGNPITEEACKSIGADEWAHSPQKGVNVCTAWAQALKAK